MLALKVSRYACEAGCDEAGRGCLAGPVFAAAVILPDHFYHEKLNDSKQVSEPLREELAEFIKLNALAYSIAWVDEQTIDRINILNASILAMHLALDGLPVTPDFIAVDGNRFKPWKKKPFSCEIKGDGRFMNIAAASILAKTARDAYMMKLHEKHPHYGWNKNKGYATKDHRDAIMKLGYTEFHRKSFILKETQMNLFDE
ncbi:MAG: ribonuclease HII [Bacteroidia bacterium]|nr:ribonuclease HII [Bacteroidia bacterium]